MPSAKNSTSDAFANDLVDRVLNWKNRITGSVSWGFAELMFELCRL